MTWTSTTDRFRELIKKSISMRKFATEQYKVTKSSASSEEVTNVNPIDTNVYATGEEITNANPIDTKVNDKSPKFIC